MGAGLAALALPATGRAQTAWPERAVRFIVPFPGGSTPDIAARTVATHLSSVFGQPFVIDNRTGAGGNLGTEMIAKATDGHTFGVSINGPISTAKALYPNLAYDPAKDLAPISLLVQAAQILVINPGVRATDLQSFIAYAKANPGKLSFGSVGAGSGGHLAMEDLKARAGIDLVHVPYRGFPQAVLDLVAGRIEAMFLTAAGILPQMREGQVKALAVTAEARLPQAPEVPTLAEAGMPDAASYAWVGMIGPASTPPERVARLSAEAQRALRDPAAKEALEKVGFEVVGSDAASFQRFIATETARWGALIQKLGLKLE
ncbi:tripartite tricarboxylate transporter substrate binding protein [Acetobacteraceae bacterium H6797]|nr:tripartite tricarboxylate transporter substrate binding protein [Acetobacteraceae bacterium H6797]